MKPEAKNYTPAKAHRGLPVPTTCRVGRSSRELKIGDDGKGHTPVACDGTGSTLPEAIEAALAQAGAK